jgi:hypothetical protein
MRRMRRFRGATMALYAMFIGFVGVPLLGVTVDLTRVWVTKAELTNAVEAACSAYANTPDVDAFMEGKGVNLGPKARSEGYRLFGYNNPKGGSLTNMSFVVNEEPAGFTLVAATCSGTATVRPMIFAGVVSFNVVKTVTVKAKFGTSTNWGKR